MPCLAEEDPNAKNGLMTKVWGPAGWLFLHCVSFGYPQDPTSYDLEHNYPVGSTRESYRRFFHEVGGVLPCRYCRDSYREYVKASPVEPHLGSRKELVAWFWEIHNRVNEKLGASYCDAGLEAVKERYESYRAKCKALTDNEVSENREKGCITPADGKPKRCNIRVEATTQKPCALAAMGAFAGSSLAFLFIFVLGYLLGRYFVKK